MALNGSMGFDWIVEKELSPWDFRYLAEQSAQSLIRPDQK